MRIHSNKYNNDSGRQECDIYSSKESTESYLKLKIINMSISIYVCIHLPLSYFMYGINISNYG